MAENGWGLDTVLTQWDQIRSSLFFPFALAGSLKTPKLRDGNVRSSSILGDGLTPKSAAFARMFEFHLVSLVQICRFFHDVIFLNGVYQE